jgi:transposase
MSNQRCTPEFKDEAVRQVLEKGHSVSAVAARLGVSAHSLYKWINAAKPSKNAAQPNKLLEAKSEIIRLRAELRRTEEERDILKEAAVDSISSNTNRCRIVPSKMGDC